MTQDTETTISIEIRLILLRNSGKNRRLMLPKVYFQKEEAYDAAIAIANYSGLEVIVLQSTTIHHLAISEKCIPLELKRFGP